MAVNLSGADSSFGKDLWRDKTKKLPNNIVSMGRRKGGELTRFPQVKCQAHLHRFQSGHVKTRIFIAVVSFNAPLPWRQCVHGRNGFIIANASFENIFIVYLSKIA